MSNGRAVKGGTVGVNGEFYEGGKFLPSTTLPKNTKKAVKFTGPRKEMTAPYTWEERPEGMRSIYAAIVGQEAIERNGIVSRYDAINPAYARTTVYGYSVDDLIAQYNAGVRWVAVA